MAENKGNNQGKRKKPIMRMEDALTEKDFEGNEEILRHAKELGMKTISMEELLSGEEEIPFLTLDNISAVMGQLGLNEDGSAVVLDHKSSDGKRSKWRTKVFISGCQWDMQEHFEQISDRLISDFGCEIFSFSKELSPYQVDDLYMLMSQMDYIVLLVSDKLFEEKCRATVTDMSVAQTYDIPVLPILLEKSAIDTYNNEIGTYELLDIESAQFKSKIATFFSQAKLAGELISRVKQSFKKRLFLSYRKKNRDEALQLLSAVKDEEELSDVSLWYDDYLVPGEDFNDEIKEGILGADAVLLLVTPEILESGNYVSGVEYPLAKASGIPVYPVAITTPESTEELEEQYPDIGEIYTPGEIVEILKEQFRDKSKLTPGEEYCIGLSYLYGIITDRSIDRACNYLFGSARSGNCMAVEKLWEMVNGYSSMHESLDELVKISQMLVDAISKRIDGGDLANAKTFWNVADKLEAYYQQEGKTEPAIRIAEMMVKYSEYISLRKADRLVACARAYFRLSVALMGRDLPRSVECIERAKEIIDEAHGSEPADFPMDVYINIHSTAIQIYQQAGKMQKAFGEGMELIAHTESVGEDSSPEMKESFMNFATRFLPLLVRVDRDRFNTLLEREEAILKTMDTSHLTATIAANLYSTVGLIYHQVDGDTEKALSAFENAYSATNDLDYIMRGSFSFYAYAKSCLDVAGCLEGLERYEDAIEYYEEALGICRDNDFRNKYIVYRQAVKSTANIFVMNMDKSNEAIDLYLEFLRYTAKVRNASSLVDMPELQYRIAYILGNYLGDREEQQAVLAKAKGFVDTAVKTYGEDKLPHQIFDIYKRILADMEE